MKKYCFILFFSLLFQAPPLFSQTRLVISKHYSPRLKFALPEFRARGESSRLGPRLTGMLRNDLSMTGFFTPLNRGQFIRETEAADRKSGRINLDEWARLGAEVLIKGNCISSPGAVVIECRAFLVNSRKQVYGKKFTVSPGREAKAIHTIADELVGVLTGEKGLAHTRIAFVSGDRGGKKVYLMDAGGENWRKINSGRGIALNPDWTPDGKKILYTSYSSGYPWVFIDTLFSRKRKVLSARPGLNAFPAVSPDGRWVALTLSRDGNNEIYKMSLDGKNLQRLTYGKANDCSPSWSPDSRRLVFTSDRSGSPQLYLMNVASRGVSRLRVPGYYNTSPAWSPGGDRIPYTSRRSGRFHLYLINLADRRVSRLTSGPANDEDPSWAPDGRHLVYSSSRRGRSNLYALDIFNPIPVQLTHGRDCFSPAWGPE